MKFLKRVLKWMALFAAGIYVFFALALLALRWVNPLTTTVQIQRRIEALSAGKKYEKRYTFVPLSRISPELRHAVVAAEDGRFYQHAGIDWKEVQKVVDDTVEDGKRPRGASTITQQLIKNLFLTTHRSVIWKAVEFALAPVAERLLSKDRMLELYLNVIEWGPGVYGAEAAARFHYGIPAIRLNRDQAARLAACIPAPRRRKPQRMNDYSEKILWRMGTVGW